MVTVKKVLSLCDSLSAIDDIRNGVLRSLVPDFMSMLKALTGPFAQQEAMTHVTVCYVSNATCVCCVTVMTRCNHLCVCVCVCPSVCKTTHKRDPLQAIKFWCCSGPSCRFRITFLTLRDGAFYDIF